MTDINNYSHGNYSATRKQNGIALIEAMVALLIVSFGALGLVGMHLFLNRNADIAKQRSEAVRLAQADMENMRIYRTMGASSAPLYWTNVIQNATNIPVSTGTASNNYTSNTSYNLTRSVINSSTANYKQIQINVTWADRTGANQAIVFRSIINGTDPSTAVSLSIAPNGSPVRDTLGRNVSIPIPSKNLGNGTSVFKPDSNSTTAVVFDNSTGLITKICTVAATMRSAQITLTDLTSCNNKTDYLLSGYIRFKNGNFNTNFDPVTANDPVPSNTNWGVSMTMNDVAPATGKQGFLSLLSKTSPAWITASNTRYTSAPGSAPPTCFTESLKTISFTAVVNYSFTNNGTPTSTTSTKVYLTVPEATTLTAAAIAQYTTHLETEISNVVDQNERFIGYSCIIEPIDLDNNPLTANAWTGLTKLTVTGTGTAASASIGTTYKVCRFSADYNLNGYVWTPATPLPAAATTESVDKIDNEEHPYAYLNVQRSLSNQNFLVIDGSQSCPSGSAVEVNGTGSEVYTNTTTVLHQP